MEECSHPKAPVVLSDKIRIIEDELKKYVSKKLIKDNDGRVLVTIPRKGHVIINHLKKDYPEIKKQLENTFKSIVSDEEFFERSDLYNKKIIVFDDAVDEGRKIKGFLKKYQKILGKTNEDFLNFRRENIKIGAFIVNEDNFPKFIKKGLLNNELIGKTESDKKKFLNTILDIIAYITHTGDIIDYEDHLIIKGTFRGQILYSKMWEILKNTNYKLYEADFGLYHLEKKKVTLYDIPHSNWIKVEHLNILNKKFQCKVRFVFDVIQCDQDLFVIKFTVAPVINPIIKIGPSQDCLEFELEFCKKFQKEPNECCVDCVLYEVITKVMHGFMERWYEGLDKMEVSIKEIDVHWNHLNNLYKYNYEDYFTQNKLKELIGIRF